MDGFAVVKSSIALLSASRTRLTALRNLHFCIRALNLRGIIHEPRRGRNPWNNRSRHLSEARPVLIL